MTRTDWPTWANAGVAATVAVVGVIWVAAGANTTVASTKAQLQELQAKQAADHDHVTSMDSKLDDLKDDVGEIKQDVKQILRDRHDQKAQP